MTTTKHEYRVIGTRPVRPDGLDKVTGRAEFGADIRLPGMLHGRVKRSPPSPCEHQEHRRLEGARAGWRAGGRHGR